MVKHLVVSLSLYFQFDLGLVLSFKKTFKKRQFGTILSWLVKVWCLHPQSVRLGYVARSRAVFCSKHPLLLFGVGFCWFCVVLLFGFVRGINVCILWTLPWNHEIFLEIKVLFFSLEFSLEMQDLGRWWVYITPLPSPQILTQEYWRCSTYSHPTWVSLPQLCYRDLCQNSIPHLYIPQPIICGVNTKIPTCVELVFCI